MPLIDMNIAPDYDSPSTYNNCPTIYLTDEQCEALGITTPPAAGTKLSLTAICKVCSVTQSDDGDEAGEGGPDIRMTLEISAMSLGSASSGSGASLYSGNND